MYPNPVLEFVLKVLIRVRLRLMVIQLYKWIMYICIHHVDTTRMATECNSVVTKQRDTQCLIDNSCVTFRYTL